MWGKRLIVLLMISWKAKCLHCTCVCVCCYSKHKSQQFLWWQYLYKVVHLVRQGSVLALAICKNFFRSAFRRRARDTGDRERTNIFSCSYSHSWSRYLSTSIPNFHVYKYNLFHLYMCRTHNRKINDNERTTPTEQKKNYVIHIFYGSSISSWW